jgi:hypothetical protein
MKEQLVWTYDYTNVFYADMFISALTILLGIIFFRNKTFRYPLLVCGSLYLSFALLWHYV